MLQERDENPVKHPGAWAGAVIKSTPVGVYKLVSEERWAKVKTHVSLLLGWAGQPKIDRKALERTRGFLVYVALTYSWITPYLKGIHLTLDSWQGDRDEEGWKMTPTKYSLLQLQKQDAYKEMNSPLQAPFEVIPVQFFKDNVEALAALTATESPLLARPQRFATAAIMFGDASGSGFGTSLWIHGSSTIHAEHGIWTNSYSSRSSNFWELYNLVARMEELVMNGTIVQATELFVFTNNSTAESAFYRGTSKSRLLFELALQVQQLEMKGAIFLRIVWVTGTHMIEQCTDGLSRGNLTNEMLSGVDMLCFVPLNKSVEERQLGLVDLFLSTMPGLFDTVWLDETGWFEQAFKVGTTFGHPHQLQPWMFWINCATQSMFDLRAHTL